MFAAHRDAAAGEIMRCLACHAEVARAFAEEKDFRYLACLSCQSLFIDPLPTDEALTAFYSSSYYNNCDPSVDLGGKALTYGELARAVASASAGGRALEVGAGTGFFLSMLNDLVVAPYGVEFSPSAIELNPFATSGRMYPSIYSIPKELRFKAVAYLDVIEHIVDLDAHLRQLADLLDPGGLVFMVTPDRTSLSARLMGRRWPHLSLPEHIVLFSRAGLASACARAGLQSVSVNTFRKRITLNYIASILDRYSKIRVDYAMAKAITTILPPVGRIKISISSGHMLAVFRKPGPATG